jgi:predicted  nucleic acid-binding Zn-ribbon protein
VGPPNEGDLSRLSQELETLFALQELDLRLLKKQREVDQYEKALQERQAAIADCDARIAKIAATRKDLVGQRALAERRVSDSQQQLKERRQRGSRVRTEGELRASEREISIMEREIGDQEDLYLQLDAQVDELEAQVAAIRKEQTDHREADHRQVEEEAVRIAGLQAEVAEQRAERDKVAADLDPALSKRYDMLLDRRAGRAVVTVEAGNCMGCHMQIPRQTVIEVMKTRAVRVCPQCMRIIFISAEPVSAT